MPMRWRQLLVVGVLASLVALPCEAKPASTPEHVVLVVMGGGIRADDMTDKTRMPTTAAMGREGRSILRVMADAPDGVSAVARLLTGTTNPGPDLATKRAQEPTLCEYVRAGLGLAREKVWYIAFDESAAGREAHSSHPNFGTSAAPRVAFGHGPIAEPLKTFLESQGRPIPLDADAFALLSGLRKVNATAASSRLPPGIRVGLPAFDRVERAVLSELDRKASLVRGPNPADERAWRAAHTVVRIYRPKLLVVRLGEAEIADAAPDRYRAVIRANDRALARLRARVAADEVMRGKTLFVVVPDRGRVDREGKLVAQAGPVSIALRGRARRAGAPRASSGSRTSARPWGPCWVCRPPRRRDSPGCADSWAFPSAAPTSNQSPFELNANGQWAGSEVRSGSTLFWVEP